MATKMKHENMGKTKDNSETAAATGPAKKVVALPTKCKAEGCKSGISKLEFCDEHYAWFKWGLVNKEGKRPIDFDKKHQAYMKHKKSA